WNEVSLVNGLSPLWIEGKKLRFFLHWPSAAAAVIAAAAENQAADRLPGKGRYALVRHHVAIIFDGPILARVPNPDGAAQFSVGWLAADVDEAAGAANHRPRPQVSIAYAAKRNGIALSA